MRFYALLFILWALLALAIITPFVLNILEAARAIQP